MEKNLNLMLVISVCRIGIKTDADDLESNTVHIRKGIISTSSLDVEVGGGLTFNFK